MNNLQKLQAQIGAINGLLNNIIIAIDVLVEKVYGEESEEFAVKVLERKQVTVKKMEEQESRIVKP